MIAHPVIEVDGDRPLVTKEHSNGRIVGRGHNRRVQRGSTVLHAEMDCLENAGRLAPAAPRQGRPVARIVAPPRATRALPALGDFRARLGADGTPAVRLLREERNARG